MDNSPTNASNPTQCGNTKAEAIYARNGGPWSFKLNNYPFLEKVDINKLLYFPHNVPFGAYYNNGTSAELADRLLTDIMEYPQFLMTEPFYVVQGEKNNSGDIVKVNDMYTSAYTFVVSYSSRHELKNELTSLIKRYDRDG
jgi:hypothetical protein